MGQRVRRAAWYHDRGKAHPDWQTACQDDYALYRDWRRQRGLDPDGVDAAEWDRYYTEKKGRTGPSLMRARLRHEIASLHACDNDERLGLSLAERVAIGAHHGKLAARHEHRWQEDGGGEFAALWPALQQTLVNTTRKLPRDVGAELQHRYEIAGVRALLQLADTRASRGRGGRGSWRPSSHSATSGRTRRCARSRSSRSSTLTSPWTHPARADGQQARPTPRCCGASTKSRPAAPTAS